MRKLNCTIAVCVFSSLLLIAVKVSAGERPIASQVLTVGAEGTLLRGGKPYAGIGVNYFSGFYRTLLQPTDRSYREGFKVLAHYKIPFARFMASGYWPSDFKLYMNDKATYFHLFDEFVAEAEKEHIGLIPSLFWNPSAVSDIVGEPYDQWGNPASKTMQFMRNYTMEVVTRYKDSPAILGWEFGNETNAYSDIRWRPEVAPAKGTPSQRTVRDQMTSTMLRFALTEFAHTVRKYDAGRMISSGNDMPRPTAFHNHNKNWGEDSIEEYSAMLGGDNPSPIDTISIHVYQKRDFRYFSAQKVDIAEQVRVSMEAAAMVKKPLFVGEFGAEEKSKFEQLLKAVEKNKVPLVALWVFDFSLQDASYNVTATNARAYQLDMVEQANARIRAALCAQNSNNC